MEVMEMKEPAKGSRVMVVPFGKEGGNALSDRTRIQRIFSFAQIFFFSLTFMSSWEVMVLNIGAVFYNGGPESLAWGVLIVIAGALAQTASLSEMVSIQPIAGAQYHWTHFLAPKRHKRFVTWMQGWVTWLGWVSLLCGVANIGAVMIQGLVISNNASYVPERWHVTLIIFAMLIVEGLINVYTFWLIPWIELLAGILHIVLFIIFVVVLVTLAPRHSPDFVFFSRAPTPGWSNSFISWNLGLLTPTWGFVGFDGAVHMSEEVRKAKQAVPRAMFWTIALNGVLAYAMCIVILFTMGSLDDALNSSFPILEICTQATGSVKAATAMVTGLTIIQLAVALGSIASVSRLTWAWSRDGALPRWFSVLSRRHRVPVRALWLPVFFTMILALLNIASTAAFGAILALSQLGLYSSYFIAIACMLYARLTDGNMSYGEWNLGRWGVPINIFALIFTAYIMVWLPFPTTIPVTGKNMNYAGPIFLVVVILALVSWLGWARAHWDGPNNEIVRLVVLDSERATKDI